MKPWLKTALKIAAVLALIPVLTFTAIFGGGYAYGQVQRSRHQRMAQSCLENSQDMLEAIVHAGKRVPELPAPLESMTRNEGAQLFYLPFDRDKAFSVGSLRADVLRRLLFRLAQDAAAGGRLVFFLGRILRTEENP